MFRYYPSITNQLGQTAFVDLQNIMYLIPLSRKCAYEYKILRNASQNIV